MRLENGFILFDKKEKKSLSKHFSTSEFACHCSFESCVEQKIASDLINELENVREALGKPITVTSGYRCHERQEELRKKGKETSAGISTHEQGRAADITAKDIAALDVACTKEFDAVGVAATFIHVDLRDDKKRRWTYQKE